MLHSHRERGRTASKIVPQGLLDRAVVAVLVESVRG